MVQRPSGTRCSELVNEPAGDQRPQGHHVPKLSDLDVLMGRLFHQRRRCSDDRS